MSFAKTTLAVLALALFAALPATVGNGDTIYVDKQATGAHDGTSWQDAFTELQSALDVVSSGDEIWVAEGTRIAKMPVGIATTTWIRAMWPSSRAA